MNPETIFKSAPLLRVVVVAPIAILTVFVLFNLLTVPDQAAVQSALKLGIVNEDQGMATPMGQIKIGEKLLAGLEGNLPLGVETIDTMDKAKSELDRGSIVAVVHFAPDFSAKVLGKDPVRVELLTARHLSAVETQIGASMTANISAGLDKAVSAIRQQFAAQMAAAKAAMAAKNSVAGNPGGAGAVAGTPSSAAGASAAAGATAGAPAMPVAAVVVDAGNLYESKGAVSEAGPRVLSFPLWLASLVAAVVGFTVLRRKDRELGPVVTGVIPAVLMIPAFAAASFCAVLCIGIVGGFPAAWGELWLFVWLGALAIGWCIWGLVRLLGLWSLVVLVPLVFLQSMVAGVMFPVAAAPAWISWLAPLVPSEAITHGVSHYLLGGPAEVSWGTLWAFAGIGVLLTAIAVSIRVIRFKSLGKVTTVSLVSDK